MFHLNKKDEKQSQVWHDFPRQLNVDPGPKGKKHTHTQNPPQKAFNKFLQAEMLDQITEMQNYYFFKKQ